MNTCPCGNPVDGSGTLCPRCTALQTLQLGSLATEPDIKAAHRMLVKVWHPDRFQNDAALRQAAEAKLKEINAAYVLLTSKSQGRGWRRPESPSQPPPPRTRRTPSRRATDAPPQRQSAWSQVCSRVCSRVWSGPALSISLRLVMLLLAALFARYLWIAFNFQGSTSEAALEVYGFSKDSVLSQFEIPKQRFFAAIDQDLHRIGIGGGPSLPPAPAPAPAAVTPPSAGHAAAPHHSHLQAAAPVQSASPVRVHSLITVGSTRQEVVDQLGAPTASRPDKLVYGSSELYLKNDSVAGWRIDPVASPIRVKLWPQAPVNPDLTSFTVGSSQDVVLVVQGTPTAFSANEFDYGSSQIFFDNGRVVRWKSDPASIALKARQL